ncbi:DUF4333 domain-containing protein [Leifsonia aquatica]|uniref:DUF4333 domain-containing protein n=1 Tax=Leifsonia aquatica TaxID=144185 RepID=UPI00385154C1
MSQLPPPGWYPDTDPLFQRWWDGNQWTEHRQLLSQSTPAIVATRPRNGLATNSLCGGIVGAVVALFTAAGSGGVTPLALLFALAGAGSALGWGIPALLRARTLQPPVGKGRATWGIAAGGTGLIVVFLLFVVTAAGGSGGAYDEASVEKSIHDEFVKNGADVEDVSCPTSPSFQEGDSFKCVVHLTSGNNRIVVVEVQDNDGSIVWEEQ